MNRKIIYSILLLLVCSVSVFSQDGISVSSFRALENDLTANTHGTMEKDFNGETAALIKVVTTEQGFAFDGGMVGIVKTKQGIGEIWVYVPHGIKKITIQHPQLGILRDYYFQIPIEKARTYEMKLTTGRVVTTVERKVSKQYVMFHVTPANAIVELDGMPLDLVDGYVEKSMPHGTYSYRVSCANYHTEAGQVVVAQDKVEMKVSLRPNFGWLKLEGANEFHGAHVYIDNDRVGQLPLTTDKLVSGTYRVKVLKSLYKTFEQQVTVTDNNTTTLNVSLVPNFASITLVTDVENEIWIDGHQQGKGKCTIGLELGEYSVEVKRPSYRTVSDVITVSDIVARTIQLPSPTPIYGALDITSTPSQATVYVDGVEMGQTPLILENVFVGSRKVTLKKEGYEPYEKNMTLTEDADNTLTAILEKEKSKVPVIANGAKKTYTVNGVSFTMVDVEGGTFKMGATREQDGDDDEKPTHKVFLNNYSIGETEVTQELWQAVMGTNPSFFTDDLQHPVDKVSWSDCQAFIKKLNQLTGENFRLPTEAEWEYASRGGKYSKGYKYSGSNTLGNVAWCADNSSNTTHVVKAKQPNELGIYDMSGNVCEWCSDWYGSYSSSAQTNPIGSLFGSYRVRRGGSWGLDARSCRVFYRGCNSPDVRNYNNGLRLVLSLGDDSSIPVIGNDPVERPKAPVGVNRTKETYTANGVSFTMIGVGGGTFTMGATSEQGSFVNIDERPAHEVTLNHYSIGESEVTQELWQAVMGRNPSNFIGNMQRPVEQVSWNECQTFIKKLNKLTGENFRLPTEAEWEFAARGGSVSKGYKYSGSNTIGDVAWFNKNSSAVHVVKSKQPNELGIYDMSGNVWEWCADKYGSYTSSAQTAPTGSSSGSDRVIRGGSWGYDEGNCRVSNRENCSPDSRGSSIGFRLAK